MALVYSQNVIEIAVRGTVSGKPHVNVWHMRQAEGTNVGDGNAAIDFRNNWQDHIVPLLTPQYTVQEFEWRSLDPDDNNVGVVPVDTAKPTAGANAGEAASVNVAMLIQKNTLNRPRGRRDGRAFMSGIAEGQVNPDGSVPAATQTLWNDALAAFWNGVTDDPALSDVDRELVVLETTPLSRAPGTHVEVINSRRVSSLTVAPIVATTGDRLR